MSLWSNFSADQQSAAQQIYSGFYNYALGQGAEYRHSPRVREPRTWNRHFGRIEPGRAKRRQLYGARRAIVGSHMARSNY